MTLGDILYPYVLNLLELSSERFDRKKRKKVLESRHQWRKADLPRLVEYKLPTVSANRIERVKQSRSRGRGIVPRKKDLATAIVDKILLIKELNNPATAPQDRPKLYRRLAIFPVMVEAAYRGELRKAQSHWELDQTPGFRPHEIAEDAVANVANISSAGVRRLCVKVRGDNVENHREVAASSASRLKHQLSQPVDLTDAEMRASQSPSRTPN